MGAWIRTMSASDGLRPDMMARINGPCSWMVQKGGRLVRIWAIFAGNGEVKSCETCEPIRDSDSHLGDHYSERIHVALSRLPPSFHNLWREPLDKSDQKGYSDMQHSESMAGRTYQRKFPA